MTIVFVDIADPVYVYENLGINNEKINTQKYILNLQNLLQEKLKKHGVQLVKIKIGQKNMQEHLYEITIENTRNEWQEEQIRIDIDIICLSFMNKNNLITF
jgi:hypothetical protein